MLLVGCCISLGLCFIVLFVTHAVGQRRVCISQRSIALSFATTHEVSIAELFSRGRLSCLICRRCRSGIVIVVLAIVVVVATSIVSVLIIVVILTIICAVVVIVSLVRVILHLSIRILILCRLLIVIWVLVTLCRWIRFGHLTLASTSSALHELSVVKAIIFLVGSSSRLRLLLIGTTSHVFLHVKLLVCEFV